CTSGLDIFVDWVIPEGIVQRRLGSFYKNNSILARVIAVPIACVSALLKVPLFPLICLVGLIAMPVLAIIRLLQRKEDARDWLKAWCFTVVGVALSLAFIMISAYSVPLVISSAILIGVFCLSIAVHTYTLVKEPV